MQKASRIPNTGWLFCCKMLHHYLELLSQAKDYAWFFTLYLMLGDTLLDAFVRAAHRGVDVRIIMPGVTSKFLSSVVGRRGKNL